MHMMPFFACIIAAQRKAMTLATPPFSHRLTFDHREHFISSGTCRSAVGGLSFS